MMDRDGGKKPKKSEASKKQAEYVRFMVLTIVCGVIICIVVFFAVFSSMDKGKNKNIKSTEKTSKIKDESLQLNKDELEILGLLISVSSADNKIGVYNIQKDSEISLVMKAGANMKDQYGQTRSLSEFKPGDIVQVAYNPNEMKYSALKISPKAWTEKSVDGLKANAQDKTIAFGNKIYKYDDILITNYKDAVFDVAELDTMDVATIKGYNDVIWSIKLEKSHGTLSLNNMDKIKEGSIEIDTNIFKTLDEVDKITVSEGLHKLVVKGSNIESFAKDIVVEKGKTMVVDLAEVKIKSGTVSIKTNVIDYKLSVNGEVKLTTEPLVLEYGTYNFRVSKEGYEDVAQDVIVKAENVKLDITLKELQKTSKVGLLTIDTGTVTGASVYVDNAYLGITPLNVKVEYGEHRVTVKKDGYTDIGVAVTINEQPKNLVFTMHSSSNATTSATQATGVNVKPIY
jgi:hypothetical protein